MSDPGRQGSQLQYSFGAGCVASTNILQSTENMKFQTSFRGKEKGK
ncbi:hypothetical protein SLEP1_g44268 [Rubroshorea leprosula]|uniref:Uncharacterized protein n=1 Tax=Rubroshorea leprosula TaxID=152421 RepID=A0AAV5LFN2_9ROSI|nr:hypothetical protein SLEP1_g44268 [Rubroshorea leprosula]